MKFRKATSTRKLQTLGLLQPNRSRSAGRKGRPFPVDPHPDRAPRAGTNTAHWQGSFLSGGKNGHHLRGKPNGGAQLDRQPLLSARPTRVVDFAELEDGCLVELIENPQDRTQTRLAVWNGSQAHYAPQVDSETCSLVPLPRTDSALRHIRLPRGTRTYGSPWILMSAVEGLIERCVQLPQPYLLVLASFVLTTWLIDRLPVAPYVAVIGLPQSGKTTLLKVLRLVCRRALLTADVSTAAFYDACDQFTPTLLIDEAGTHGNNRTLRHLLRAGTTQDVVAMRRNHSYHAYGAKVLSFIEPPDDLALNSRCIQVPMTEATRSDLLPPTDPIIEAQAAELQKALLQFRFEHYKSIRPAVVPGAEKLRPRDRDLLSCLAAPFRGIGFIRQFLLKFFEMQAHMKAAPLPLAENAVLSCLYFLAHFQPGLQDGGVIAIANLARSVNAVLKLKEERIKLSPRKVGAALTSLGISDRLRTKRGCMLFLTKADRERIHKLADTHGMDYTLPWMFQQSAEGCDLCHARAQAQGQGSEPGEHGGRGEHLRRKRRKKRKKRKGGKRRDRHHRLFSTSPAR